MAVGWRVWVGLVGVVAVGVVGCAPAKGGGQARAAASGAPASPSPTPTMPMVIGEEQAKAVFNQYVWERSASLDRHDSDRITQVETGPLLAESLAQIDVFKKRASSLGWYGNFRRPEFLIPAEKDQQAYPRFFLVVSRPNSSQEGERAGIVHYFLQADPGAAWKAAASSWVLDKPLKPGQPDDLSHKWNFTVRDKEIAPVGRDAGGAVKLSPTAGEARGVCDRYADYMDFTAPNGEPESKDFVPGKLTSEVVKAYNHFDEDLELVRKRYGFEVTGPELPVLQLGDGKSLVTCSFIRADTWTGRDARFKYGSGSHGDIDAMLGGGHQWWDRTSVRHSVTVTFEVPPTGPAEVVGSNALKAPVLSAEGTPG